MSSSFLHRDLVKPGTSLRPKCKVGFKGREKGVITAHSSHRGPLAVTTKGTKLQFLPRVCSTVNTKTQKSKARHINAKIFLTVPPNCWKPKTFTFMPCP